MLVDTDKNIYLLKKCKEYIKFCEVNSEKYDSKEDLFNAFLENNNSPTRNISNNT